MDTSLKPNWNGKSIYALVEKFKFEQMTTYEIDIFTHIQLVFICCSLLMRSLQLSLQTNFDWFLMIHE